MGALDLHVLGLPPAFVLSQDQTLKLKTPGVFNPGPRSGIQNKNRRSLTRLNRSHIVIMPRAQEAPDT